MSRWVIKGCKTGILSTKYPSKKETALGITPGMPQGLSYDKNIAETLIARCPMNALEKKGDKLTVNYKECIHCYRCARGIDTPLPWSSTFEWAEMKEESTIFPKAFQKALNILVVDAGDCGACLNEVKLLNNPFYNIHRLGFFITPTPRKADVLLVVGPVTDHMKIALKKAYDAMPSPKRVMAVGTCALNGGIFKTGFVSSSGVNDIIPVDIKIPGCPPPPLAILHALLVLTGRKPSSQSEGLHHMENKENRDE